MMNVIPDFRYLMGPRQTASQLNAMKLHKRFQCGMEIGKGHIQK